jgi:hypothetical protein
MFEQKVRAKDVAFLLDLPSSEELAAVPWGEIGEPAPTKDGYCLSHIMIFKLAEIMKGLGIEPAKAFRYAEAVLRTSLFSPQEEGLLASLEDETEKLYCQIADNQLARIFVRNADDQKERELGAVKPVLLPTTRCEINVFRAVRPILYRAQRLRKKGK